MSLSRMQPNQYVELGVMSGTSTGASIDFAFNATYLRLRNQGAGTYYINLGSSAQSTGSGYPLTSGETWAQTVPQCARIGLAATTTEDGVDVLALG